MRFAFNPFTGNFDLVGSGGSGSVSIGGAISGADPDRILFTDASGNLAQSLDLFYSDSARSFSIGGGIPDIGMIFGGTIQHTDGTTLVFNSGINVGEFAVNPSFANNVYFRVGANTSGYLMATDPLNEWINFGTNSDLGGFVNMIVINALDDTLRIRAKVGQSGKLVYFQSAGLATLGYFSATGVFLSQGLIQGISSPSTITADQNNYTLPDQTIVRLSSDAQRNITGFLTDANSPGRMARLVNVGSFNIVLQNQNASSTASNRIITGLSKDLVLAPDQSVDIYYDDVSARWRCF